ncbi:MAG: mannose-1-phosphate guanyltransferase [Deltaproteobacteria bacterium]|nr:mannose-1-phosphate guanyltransferase [Deltaproteobacteria bacterium]
MKGVIMAGGFGTRLRPLTNNMPKPMVNIVNRPMMEHVIDRLTNCGITDIISLLYFHPEMIENHFGDGSKFGVKMSYTSPPEDLGTAGSVKYAQGFLDNAFLVISGDVLTDFDLSNAIEFHRKNKAKATMVLTRVENPLPFGIVITDDSGKIVRFLEKPSWGEVFSDTINTGIYILEPDVLNYIPERQEFDFSKDLFPLLLEKKEPLYGYIAEGYWKDVGSLEEYRRANIDVLTGKVKVNIPGQEISGKSVWLENNSKIDFTSKLEGSVVIGSGSRVNGNAKVVNSVIGKNCLIQEGAVLIDTVLWDNVSVGSQAMLQENVIGNNTEIKERAFIGEGAIVSDHCYIGRQSIVKANVRVWPYKIVEDGATLASSLIWGEKWAKNIFGAYGITGLANLEISPEFAAKLGAAYGASLKKGATVSTSRDTHKTSRMINRAVMTGILSTGVNVHDYGVVPMPVVRYLARGGSGEIGGIHARRSPFDAEVVDLKFFESNGLDLHSNQEKTIERLFYREDFRRAAMEETGEVSFPIHGFEHYQNGFMSKIDIETIKKANFKLVLDYSYGSSTRIFPGILGKLNCDVIALNANLDAVKITKTAEEFNKSLEQLSTIVRSLKADIGIFLDAGGEKIFLVDENGDIIDGDMALNLVSVLVMKSYSNSQLPDLNIRGQVSIAVPVTASRVIDNLAEVYGFKVKRTKTSARGMMETAMENNVAFVGEQTGGFIFPQFQPAFDGMFAIVKLLEMMAKKGIRLHGLTREIPPSFMVKERVSCSWEKKGMIMRNLMEDSKTKDVQLIDGIKIFFDKDWVVAYPSQDNAYFHIIAEASTKEKADEIAKTYVNKIEEWQK